jgi:hypothetical protein
VCVGVSDMGLGEVVSVNAGVGFWWRLRLVLARVAHKIP